VEDRADLEIGGLDRAERPLDAAQDLVCFDGGSIVEQLGRQAGAHDVDTVEGGFLGDGVGLAAELEAGLPDGQLEVLGHLVAV
jgi:hypothetical protein